MPCRKDWVVLDGLNYIKDQLDGTLSYRWSCRMGICGSCGMTVNGEPKLTCATFLTDYAPGPVRVEPLRNFPVVRDLVVEIGDFMRKLTDGQAVDRPRGGEAAVGGRVPADAGAAGRVQAVQHVHQLHAVLRRLPGVRPGPEVHRAGGHRPGPALQPRLARPGGRGAAATSSSDHEGIWGCTFVGECTRGLPEARRSGRRHPALQADGGAGRGSRRSSCRGGRDERARPAYTEYHPRWYRPRMSTCWWLERRSYLAVHPARAEQRLRRLVRRVPAAAGPRGQPGRATSYRQFLDWAGTPWRAGAERRQPVLRRLPRGHLVQPGARRRWWCGCGGKRVPGCGSPRPTTRPGRSCRRSWPGSCWGDRWPSDRSSRSCGCCSAPAACWRRC